MMTGKHLLILINVIQKHWVKLKRQLAKSAEKTCKEKRSLNENFSSRNKLQSHTLQYEFCDANRKLSTKDFLFSLNAPASHQITMARGAIHRQIEQGFEDEKSFLLVDWLAAADTRGSEFTTYADATSFPNHSGSSLRIFRSVTRGRQLIISS